MIFEEYLDFLDEYWSILEMPEKQFNPDSYRIMLL